MAYTWRTNDDMTVDVDEGSGFKRPMLPGGGAATERVLGLVPNVLRPAAERWLIPLSWLCAIAWHESGGDPRARNTASNDWGLMQINHANFKWLGLDETTALQAGPNVEAACKLIDALGNSVTELPEVLSGYNSGLDPKTSPHRPYVSPKSPWNMRETTGFISSAVAASNWFIVELERRGLSAHYVGTGGASRPVAGASSAGSSGGGLIVAAFAIGALAYFSTRK